MVRTKDICDKLNRFNTLALERKDDYVQTLRETFNFNIAHERVTRNTNTTMRDVWISNGDLANKTVGFKKIFSYPYNPIVFSLGDYVNWNNKRYLIESLDTTRIYEVYGRMFECNHTLKWYDENGVLQEWESVIFSGSKLKAFAEDKNMRLPQGSIYGFVQMNSNTSQLSNGDQFIIGSGKAVGKYEMTFEDDFEDGELLKFSLMRYQKNAELDDIANGVANFANRPRFTLTANIDTSQIGVGNTVQIQTTLLDKDGNTSDKPLTYVSSDTAICTVSNTGLITAIANGTCTITVRMTNNSSVTDTINMTVTATPVDNITYSVSPDISTIYRRQNETFTVQKYNNGNAVSDTYTITMDSSTASASDYEFATVGNDGFRIRNLRASNSNIVIRITPVARPGDVFTRTFEFSGNYG